MISLGYFFKVVPDFCVSQGVSFTYCTVILFSILKKSLSGINHQNGVFHKESDSSGLNWLQDQNIFWYFFLCFMQQKSSQIHYRSLFIHHCLIKAPCFVAIFFSHCSSSSQGRDKKGKQFLRRTVFFFFDKYSCTDFPCCRGLPDMDSSECWFWWFLKGFGYLVVPKQLLEAVKEDGGDQSGLGGGGHGTG